jgi:hypothetical protein
MIRLGDIVYYHTGRQVEWLTSPIIIIIVVVVVMRRPSASLASPPWPE